MFHFALRSLIFFSVSPRHVARCIHLPPIFHTTYAKYEMDRAHIISSDASDVVRTRTHTPKVASFLRDVALRNMAVRATHAAYVDGRGDTYQWGNGIFAQHSESSVRKSKARPDVAG